MATFNNLDLTAAYDIIDGEDGSPITSGIMGADAMAASWPDAAEAWPAGESEFRGQPIEVTE